VISLFVIACGNGTIDSRDPQEIGADATSPEDWVARSDYFADDISRQIVKEGLQMDYIDLYEGVVHPLDVDATKYQYKVYSALRMVGYALPGQDGEFEFARWARVFKEQEGIEPSYSYALTPEFIIALDSDMAEHEEEVRSAVSTFPIIGFPLGITTKTSHPQVQRA
jgi:hypothetical protein